MSGALIGGFVGGSVATLGITALERFIFIKPMRGFATDSDTLIPDCVIEEISRDEMEITDHPVETGAPISDHAFKRPAEVTLRYGWSNSSLYADGSEDYVKEIFLQLVALQKNRTPFMLYTGKRVYTNMLLQSLGQTTNADSEYSLMVVASCREVIRVSTQSAQVAPRAAQAFPQQTAGTDSTGAVTPQAVDQSLIKSATTNPVVGGVVQGAGSVGSAIGNFFGFGSP